MRRPRFHSSVRRYPMNRFPDFGKDVKRPFAVAENCYDCAAFYEGCKGWRASKEFDCGHYQRLPDVMPGTYGQPFPDKAFLPENPDSRAASKAKAPKRKTSAPVASPIDPKRRCVCGRHLPRRRRYCDACRENQMRAAKLKYERGRPERSHHGAPVAVGAARRPVSAAVARGDS